MCGAGLVALLAVWRAVAAVQIVRSAPARLVRPGDPLDLYCESDTPYQWCYWYVLLLIRSILCFDILFSHCRTHFTSYYLSC